MRSLIRAQRAALDRWFEAHRKAMKGLPEGSTPNDHLIKLHKEGATKDLSNVDAGFATIPQATWQRRPLPKARDGGQATQAQPACGARLGC